MLDEVNIWIEQGKDLGEGIKLLEYFKQPIHKNVERYRGKSVGSGWAHDWVYQRLTSLKSEEVSPAANATPEPPPAAVVAADQVRKLTDEERKVYKELDASHANLRHATTDQERLEAAKDIMEHKLPAKDAIFEAKQVAVHGSEGQEQKQTELTAEQLKARNNLRSLVSKLLAKIAKGGSEEKLKEWKNKLATAQAELESYE